MSIDVKELCFSYESNDVLRHVSFSAREGELMAVLGPNGVGKSTLFGCMLGFLRPSAGEITIGGRPLTSFTNTELAREIAYIPQSVAPAFNYTVLDMVTMGMTNQIGLLHAPGQEHKEKAMAALESLGIAGLASRGCNQISGGERQLMLLARALVQKARLLIMDEPTANLDYGNSYRVMQRIRTLGEQGYTVIFSTHEPNHAFRYADQVLALKGGKVLTKGRPAEVLTEEVLSALYSIRVAVRGVDVDGTGYHVSIPCERGEYR